MEFFHVPQTDHCLRLTSVEIDLNHKVCSSSKQARIWVLTKKVNQLIDAGGAENWHLPSLHFVNRHHSSMMLEARLFV